MNGLGCRFRAEWSEGQVAREGFHEAAESGVRAGEDPPTPSAQVVALALSRPANPPEFAAVLRLARERRLSSVYDPAGVSFSEATPILIDHGGIEVGRVLVVSLAGDRFSVQGWVHPDHADDVRARGHVSPAHWVEDGRIEAMHGLDVLRVLASSVVEISATAEPARSGTVVTVGPPRPVPSPDWEALQTLGSAFAPEFVRFVDGPRTRLRLTAA
jgi:hypothetical protein